MESAPRQVCTLENQVQHAQHVPRVQRGAHAKARTAARVGREDQIGVAPVTARFQALFQLTRAVHLEGLEADCRQHERAPALLSLQRLQQKLFPDALELLTDAQLPRLEAHVAPLQPGRLTES